MPEARSPSRHRGRAPLLAATIVTGLGLAGLAPLAAAASGGSISTLDLLSDPAELTGAPWYLGAVSTLGVLVWAAAAAAYLLGGFGLQRREPRLAATFRWLALVTVVLALDDQFMLHEIAIPWIVGVTEEITFALYVVLAATVTWWGRRALLARPEVVVFGLAIVAFGASVALDVLGPDVPGRRELEEVAKMIGVVAWAVFPGTVVVRSLRAGDDAPPSGGPR